MRKLWWLIPLFVEVIGRKLVRGPFCYPHPSHPLSWIGLRKFLSVKLEILPLLGTVHVKIAMHTCYIIVIQYFNVFYGFTSIWVFSNRCYPHAIIYIEGLINYVRVIYTISNFSIWQISLTRGCKWHATLNEEFSTTIDKISTVLLHLSTFILIK